MLQLPNIQAIFSLRLLNLLSIWHCWLPLCSMEPSYSIFYIIFSLILLPALPISPSQTPPPVFFFFFQLMVEVSILGPFLIVWMLCTISFTPMVSTISHKQVPKTMVSMVTILITDVVGSLSNSYLFPFSLKTEPWFCSRKRCQYTYMESGPLPQPKKWTMTNLSNYAHLIPHCQETRDPLMASGSWAVDSSGLLRNIIFKD